jgi:drug/metabolite transporter (DMT)-like permease
LRRHPLLLPYLALASVCFFWGTTYTGIRMALESFPPLLLVGTRFTISGSILLGALFLAGVRMPAKRDLLYSGLFGLAILGVGNSCLTFAETWIPSSLAALFVTTSPFWLTGLEAAFPGGERLRGLTVAGMLIGLAGTALLVAPGWNDGFSGNVMKGFLVLQLGCFSWCLGSIAQRRRIRHMNAVLNGAVQQLAAGIGFLALAAVVPEHPVAWSVRGVSAVLYLVVFGSIVGYTSYIYTLKTLPVAVVALYNYVNPVVAAVLGWLLFREHFGWRETAGMAVIFLGVFIVSRASSPRDAAAPTRVPGPWRPSLRQESGGA